LAEFSTLGKGRTFAPCTTFITEKLPNLKWKTWPKQLLGSLSLTFALPCVLYYKPIMIVNDSSRVINKLETSLTVNTRVIIYDRHMFIVQATDESSKDLRCQRKHRQIE
jgi:hypothetical protein